ncbi:tRNA sulfurtransferase ThiI [Pseudomonas psychrotolerans]|nr:tRNA sulfurtransferase ThiI [Pseudomonas psychrotolerans]
MKLIIKVFPEITIKSRPVRKNFIRQLVKNIRVVLRDLDPDVLVDGVWDNVTLDTAVSEPRLLAEMKQRLACTPGIGQFLEVHEYPLGDFETILALCERHFGERVRGKVFSVRCKRAGKHDFSSMDVERYVGGGLRERCGGAGIALKNPEVNVRLEIRDQKLFIIDQHHEGLGGYPLGALEQVLVLMSGGFDSTVAAYQMMRRGMVSHFCFFNLGGRAHELGVMEVAHYLWEKFGRSQRVLFISVPFEEVVGQILTQCDDSHMGVILKRMMLRAASRIAEQLQIEALVTGEAVSQVSSQTLTNLAVIDKATDTLVLRPLLASHKQDIIDTAERIGTRRLRQAHAGILRRHLGESHHQGQGLPGGARGRQVRHGGARRRPGARPLHHRRQGDRRAGQGRAGRRAGTALARSDRGGHPPSRRPGRGAAGNCGHRSAGHALLRPEQPFQGTGRQPPVPPLLRPRGDEPAARPSPAHRRARQCARLSSGLSSRACWVAVSATALPTSASRPAPAPSAAFRVFAISSCQPAG